MFNSIVWIILGGAILAAVVVLWFIVYYLLNPGVEEPDGHASITGKCGDTMEISLNFQDGKVVKTSCWTDGCAYSYNSVWAAAELAKGKGPEEILEIDADCIKEYIGGLPSDHLHCAQLAEETLQAALDDYMVKIMRRKRSAAKNQTKYCVDTSKGAELLFSHTFIEQPHYWSFVIWQGG